jgi:uncharacterized membrane protein YgaE (UPF0421/DUF939 family)
MMRKRYSEQDALFPDLDYVLMLERQSTQAQSAESFSAKVSKAYEQLDLDQDLAQFNQTMEQLNREAGFRLPAIPPSSDY